MAAIDSLLRLVAFQRADALRIRPGVAPALIIGETERPLSMPALTPEMVDGFLEEIFGDAWPLDGEGSRELSHEMSGGGPFHVTVSLQGGKVTRATFRPGTTGARAEPGQGHRAGTRQESGRALAVSVAPSASVSGADPALSSTALGSARDLVRDSARDLARASVRDSARPSGAGASPALLGLLCDAQAKGASDLFLSTGRPARWRIGGQLSALEDIVPVEGELEAMLGEQLTPLASARLAEHGSVDIAFGLPAPAGGPTLRFRVSLFEEDGGLVAAFRVLGPRAPTVEELNLPPSILRLVEHRHGLVLMVGPTGSGKSSTLSALIEQLNGTVARHVITIEDPIELRYVPRRCLIHQREVGAHVSSFADGIRSALRSSPDVILVGEMRDPETIAAALTAAETGHLVLSTLHCGTAGMAVDRIVDAFPEARQNQVRLQLADVLRSVVSQRLLPAVRGGLVPALEILHVTRAVGALIREGRGHQVASLIQTGREAGMVPLERSLAELVRAGRVSTAVAMEAAEDPAALQDLLRR
ncbi:MAG: PilT/PilU family type 4a pilus ATPase [Polyangia bacterium]|jgi:twitching motility protein PilT|nr:PilT/PilU family type 4a pilus ATPase [Polyangia bacterium]